MDSDEARGTPEVAPLLNGAPASRAAADGDRATSAQTLGNVVVSIVGTGVLGLPYAFRMAGWVAGSLGVASASLATYYCMLLLVECRDKLRGVAHIETYGDLGAKAFGTTGRYLTELLVFVSQAGGATAYLVFIGQNLSSSLSTWHSVSPSIFIFLLLLLEIALSFIRSLSSLAPFSTVASICNVLSMAIVVKEELQLFNNSIWTRNAFNGLWAIPFAIGVAVFCFEGFSMTLALESSMAEKGHFRWVLSQAFVGITLIYICFGILGYLAYGDETSDIITLNLPNNWSAVLIKVGLCIALAFTFPIMMHPIHEILEAKLKSTNCYQNLCCNVPGAEWFGLHVVRMLMLFILSVLASFIPGFGAFISFVGSTVCALLSFVLPAIFHLKFMGSSLDFKQRLLDYSILLLGVVFAGYGVYDVVSSCFS